MSELSELLNVTKNIEKQNEEIIRLLKTIVGENQETEEKGNEDNQEDFTQSSIDVGEVLFIDDLNVFKLSIENNETIINNLTGTGETDNFKIQELVAKQSIKNNQSVGESTYVLNVENCKDLPATLKVCYEKGAREVYLPWSVMTQLIGAPEAIMSILKLNFYKTEDELMAILFD